MVSTLHTLPLGWLLPYQHLVQEVKGGNFGRNVVKFSFVRLVGWVSCQCGALSRFTVGLESCKVWHRGACQGWGAGWGSLLVRSNCTLAQFTATPLPQALCWSWSWGCAESACPGTGMGIGAPSACPGREMGIGAPSVCPGSGMGAGMGTGTPSACPGTGMGTGMGIGAPPACPSSGMGTGMRTGAPSACPGTGMGAGIHMDGDRDGDRSSTAPCLPTQAVLFRCLRWHRVCTTAQSLSQVWCFSKKKH